MAAMAMFVEESILGDGGREERMEEIPLINGSGWTWKPITYDAQASKKSRTFLILMCHG